MSYSDEREGAVLSARDRGLLVHLRLRRPPCPARAAWALVCAGLAAAAVLLVALPVSATPRGILTPRPVINQTNAQPLTAERRLPADGVDRPPGCFVPADTLTYHGGDLIAHANVFLLFWGNEWANDPQHQAAAAEVATLYQDIGATGYACSWDEFSLVGNTIGPSTYSQYNSGTAVGSFIIPTEPSNPLLDSTIQGEILSQIASGNAPPASDDQVYVVLPPKGVPVDAGGVTGCGGTNFVFCGYHDSFRRPSDSARIRYIVLPFPCSQGGGTCFFVPSPNPGDSLQVVASHELGESVTDPDALPVAAGGWFSDRTGSENADICSPCNGTVTAGTDTLQVNSLWSNLAHGCVDSVPCAVPTPACTDQAPGLCIPGRSRVIGCAFEWLVYPNLTLQASGLPGNSVTCTDGEPFCDVDNAENGQCTFRVAACLNNSDPRLSCTPAPITAVQLTAPVPTSANPTNSGNAMRMLNALSQMPGAPATISKAKVLFNPPLTTTDTCTGYVDVVVPIRTVGTRRLAGRLAVGPMVITGGGRALDRLVLTCKPGP